MMLPQDQRTLCLGNQMVAIKIDNISKSFGSKQVLDAISVTIQPQQMVALIGPSGAGKSTLLRQLSGLAPCDANGGSIQIGDDLVQQNGKVNRRIRRIRGGIGFVFQQFNLVGRMSLITNVLVGGLAKVPIYRRLIGYFTWDEKRRAMEALQFVGLTDQAAQRASTLSGGQQQRGAIARAIVQQAPVILADEPIASLDPESARLVMQGLRDMNRQQHATVVVSLHQIDYATRYCDRIIAMKDGRIVCDCPADELAMDHLRTIYGESFDREMVGEQQRQREQQSSTSTDGLEADITAMEARAVV